MGIQQLRTTSREEHQFSWGNLTKMVEKADTEELAAAAREAEEEAAAAARKAEEEAAAAAARKAEEGSSDSSTG